MFKNEVTQTFNHQDATLEILIMLAGALILGALLSWLLSKLARENNNIDTQNLSNNDLVTAGVSHSTSIPKTPSTDSDIDFETAKDIKRSVHNIEKEYQSAISQPYTKPRIDNLTKISGITTKLESQLKENGIKSFTDLRDTDSQTLVKALNISKSDAITEEAQFWPHQASLAAKGDWKKLSEYQSFLKRSHDRVENTQIIDHNKNYDDLTKIEGIGPKIEEILNSNNINTYKLLMKSDRDTLKSHLDQEGSRFDKNEPETWPLQAGMAERGEWEELKIYQEFMDDDSSFFTENNTDNITDNSNESTMQNNVSDILTTSPSNDSDVVEDEKEHKSHTISAESLSAIDAITHSKKSKAIEESKNIKDDLKKIDGIGPKIQDILNNKGINSYQDLEESDHKSIKTYLIEAGNQFKLHEPESWPKQAGFARKGEWRQLDEYQDFMQGMREASQQELEKKEEEKEQDSQIQSLISGNSNKEKKNTAPKTNDSVKSLADDLKKIEGIGPKIEELLHKAGIDTFEKLHDCNSATIKDLLDTAGPQFRMHKPDTWPHQAKMAFKGEWQKLEEYQDFLLGGRE